MESSIEYVDGKYIDTDPDSEDYGEEIYSVVVDDVLTSENGTFSADAIFDLDDRSFSYGIVNHSKYKTPGYNITVNPFSGFSIRVIVDKFEMNSTDELYQCTSCLVELADFLDELKNYNDSGKIFENEDVLNSPTIQKFLNA